MGSFNFINGLFGEPSISVGFMKTSLSFSVCKLYPYDILKDFFFCFWKNIFFELHQFVKLEIFRTGSFWRIYLYQDWGLLNNWRVLVYFKRTKYFKALNMYHFQIEVFSNIIWVCYWIQILAVHTLFFTP